MKWIVFYSERCTPKIKVFKARSTAVRWANRFDREAAESKNPDNWVDCLMYGYIAKTYPAWYGEPVKLSK